MTRDYKKQAEWKRANQVYIGLALSRSTDADIIEYIGRKQDLGFTKQGIIKRCIRAADCFDANDGQPTRVRMHTEIRRMLNDPSPSLFEQDDAAGDAGEGGKASPGSEA